MSTSSTPSPGPSTMSTPQRVGMAAVLAAALTGGAAVRAHRLPGWASLVLGVVAVALVVVAVVQGRRRHREADGGAESRTRTWREIPVQRRRQLRRSAVSSGLLVVVLVLVGILLAVRGRVGPAAVALLVAVGLAAMTWLAWHHARRTSPSREEFEGTLERLPPRARWGWLALLIGSGVVSSVVFTTVDDVVVALVVAYLICLACCQASIWGLDRAYRRAQADSASAPGPSS